MFEGLVRLEILDLSENEITHIREGSLKPMKALKQLNLRHNKLITLSEQDFQFVSHLDSIKLAENPWSCDCANVKLMTDFMINNSRHIDDVNEVACEQYDTETMKTRTHLLFVHKQKFCANNAVVNTSDKFLIIFVFA